MLEIYVVIISILDRTLSDNHCYYIEVISGCCLLASVMLQHFNNYYYYYYYCSCFCIDELYIILNFHREHQIIYLRGIRSSLTSNDSTLCDIIQT